MSIGAVGSSAGSRSAAAKADGASRNGIGLAFRSRKIYLIVRNGTIDIGRLRFVRNRTSATLVDCLDAPSPLCKSARVCRHAESCSQFSREDAMTTFDKREEGFEKKFAHDEELRFKASARRNKMLGMWVAEKLGLTGAEADAYAKEVVMSDFEEAGDHDVFKKIRKDLDAKGVAVSDQQLRSMMTDLMEQAIAQIKAS
jgi:hypothetical protein